MVTMIVVIVVIMVIVRHVFVPDIIEIERPIDLVLIFDKHTWADRFLRLNVTTAVEVVGVVRTPGTVIDRLLGERTQWPSSSWDCAALCEYLVRCDAVLNPVHHCIEQAHRLRSIAAAAVRNARSSEVAEPGLEVVEIKSATSVVSGDLFVIIKRVVSLN